MRQLYTIIFTTCLNAFSPLASMVETHDNMRIRLPSLALRPGDSVTYTISRLHVRSLEFMPRSKPSNERINLGITITGTGDPDIISITFANTYQVPSTADIKQTEPAHKQLAANSTPQRTESRQASNPLIPVSLEKTTPKKPRSSLCARLCCRKLYKAE